jgi:hypothetical protein
MELDVELAVTVTKKPASALRALVCTALLAFPARALLHLETRLVHCSRPPEVRIFGNHRAESSSSFSFGVPSRTRTVRKEARENLGKKFVKNQALYLINQIFSWRMVNGLAPARFATVFSTRYEGFAEE